MENTLTPIYKRTTTTPEEKDENGNVTKETASVDSYFNDDLCTKENSEYAGLVDKTSFDQKDCPPLSTESKGGRRRSKKSKKSKKAKKTKKSKKSKKTKKSRKH